MCRERLADEDLVGFRVVSELAESVGMQVALVGEMFHRDNVQSLTTYESLLDEELNTTVDATASGLSSILCPGDIDKSLLNGRAGAIKTGLSHLAIPRGWSWGGPASPFCPIWAEIKIPD
ncbi:hypothetical protein O3G_MSEX014559 [Manduca sexta]|uniref:Uncharacterized protein n=2 Tax=Manduca sexta TaxID=7130 RepID=A0A921ZVK5_MANSE|nr:hypothetical protein O3G_MSEX014559 [Manduca sexta]